MARKTTKSAGKPRKAPKTAAKTAKAPRTPKPATPRADRPRDPRLPAPGTTIVRPYKGKEYRVTVLEQGFRFEGKEYRSLSALAATITGAKAINGFFWFRLTEAKTAAPEAEKSRRVAKRTTADGAPAAEAAPESAAEAATA